MKKYIPITIEGEEQVVYITQEDQKGLKLVVTLTVGEETFRLAAKPPLYNRIDEEFVLNGETYRFVLHMGDCDLVKDGKFLSSGKPYAPVKAFHPLFVIPMLLNLFVPVATLGGAFPIMASVVGILLALGLAGSPFDSFLKRFLLSIGYPLLMIVCFYLMYDGLALLK
jgi:hypothetical protein